MKTLKRDISDYLFVLIAFYIIDDAVTVYKLLRFGYGLLQEWGDNWGITLRIIGPAALIFIGVWRFRETDKRLAFCLFGVSRFISFHSIVIQRNLDFGLLAMGVALLIDIVAFCFSITAFKRSNARKETPLIRRILLRIMLVVCMSLLIAIIVFVVRILPRSR